MRYPFVLLMGEGGGAWNPKTRPSTARFPLSVEDQLALKASSASTGIELAVTHSKGNVHLCFSESAEATTFTPLLTGHHLSHHCFRHSHH